MAKSDPQARWIEVKIACNGELAEALAEVLGRFVSNGVVVESETRFNPSTQENEPTGGMIVYGYLPVDDALEGTRHQLEQALWHLSKINPLPPVSYRPVHDEDWMAAWKVHYQPIKIGETLLVMPAWKSPTPGESRLVVRINPAMAFGTGTHPTTQLCLRLLERHFSPGCDLIDVGCGSGILTIAALNNISSAALETGKGSVEEILTGRFAIQNAPLVLVNILAPIIMRLFDQGLANLVTEGGSLLLSGILADQEAEVRQAAEASGFALVERLTDEDWVSLAMAKITQ